MTKLLHKLFKEPTNNTWVQLLRYFFVGGFAFVVDFGILYILTEFAGLHYILSATISFIAGLVCNYLLSIHWVFSERVLKSSTAEFTVYALIGIAGIGLNAIIIWCSTEYLSLHYLISKIIAAVIVFLWNFIARKYILFNVRNK